RSIRLCGDGDIGPIARSAQRDRKANAAARAGNEKGLARQTHALLQLSGESSCVIVLYQYQATAASSAGSRKAEESSPSGLETPRPSSCLSHSVSSRAPRPPASIANCSSPARLAPPSCSMVL